MAIYDMEPGPSQSTMGPLPPPIDEKRIEFPVASIGIPIPNTVEPPYGSADPDDPEENAVDAPHPFGIKLTVYRLLNPVILLTIGFAKFILSLKGQSVAPTGLEWAAGSVLAALLYWIGLYETVQPPKWEWFLHVDLAPVVFYASQCFLRGFLRAIAIYLEMLPFCLFAGAPFIVLVHAIPLFPVPIWFIVNTLNTWLLVAVLTYNLPEKWRMWKYTRVWTPVRRFLKYESHYPTPSPTRRRYRILGKAGFIIGLSSGLVPTNLSIMVVFYFLQ